jgi:UTP--glucose-1-phosphate uridylyltransferase
MRPLTSVIPKEMLPLGGRPAVEHIIEELHSAGINDIIFVVSNEKPGIRSYFGSGGGGISISYVFQEEQRGLADAILCAEESVCGQDFVVALGDTVMVSREQVSPTGRLISSFLQRRAFASIIVERVPEEDCVRYGMVRPSGASSGGSFPIDGLVEKPAPGESPSNLAIGGRYVFSPGIFDCIRRTGPGALGEIQITDAVGEGIACGESVWCTEISSGEGRYDIGSISSYCRAFAAVCALDSELARSVSAGLQLK